MYIYYVRITCATFYESLHGKRSSCDTEFLKLKKSPKILINKEFKIG